MALAFRDDEALRAVIASGLCPPEIQAAAARVGRTAEGTIVVAPAKALSRSVVAALVEAGVATDAALPDDARSIACWAEALALQRVGLAETPPLVLFATREPDGARAPDALGLVDLAAELLRLGCDRQELQIGGGRGLLRAVDPPTYTVMRALDREGGLRAYVPDPVGQDMVWTELGYHHPLATAIRAAAGTLVLVGSDGWTVERDEGWRALDAALELAVARPAVPRAESPITERRRVPLRLAPGRREVGSLWVLRDQAIAAIDQLLAYLPDEVVGRLAIAITADPEPTIIVRARGGRQAPPELALPATVERYAALSQLADVFAPVGMLVEPPLRRDRLAEVLAVPHGQIAWLAPVADAGRGAFRVEHIPDRAFVPLSEWTEYVVQSAAAELEPWARAATFDFAPYILTDGEWGTSPQRNPSAEPAEKRPRRAAPVRQTRPGVSPAREPMAPTIAAPPPTPVVVTAVDAATIDAELSALEAEFLALDVPADAPERQLLFRQLGTTYARVGRARDSGLCFARATWELTGAAANRQLDEWLAIRSQDELVQEIATALELTAPNPDVVRRLAAIAARAPAALTPEVHRVQRWLDAHDADLDIRTLWLARVSLSRLAGNDTLGLARIRDRILARLAAGLPLERELPAFLRAGTRAGALGNASADPLASALERLRDAVFSTPRRASPVEAPLALTNAYVELILAHGHARLGRSSRARELIAAAQRVLQPLATDAVHAYLATAFIARVNQAIAGQSAEAPLPDALGAELAGLDRVSRYKVDRLREASRILAPVERPDAIGAFSKHQRDARGPEFAALRELTDLEARAAQVAKLVAAAARTETSGDDRARLVDGIFDVLLELREADASSLFARTVALVPEVPEPLRAGLFAEALVVAGHFGRTEHVPALLEALGTSIPAAAGADLERALDQSLRALRRFGLRAEVATLLASTAPMLPPGTAGLRARLALAGGMAFLGDTANALPILDQARTALGQPLTPTARLDLVRALAQAYSQCPLPQALAGISELSTHLREITDSFGTNSHYCLSVLHFVESLVLGIASDDLALGESGRRFVEDDEYLIRRRLHRDLPSS